MTAEILYESLNIIVDLAAAMEGEASAVDLIVLVAVEAPEIVPRASNLREGMVSSNITPESKARKIHPTEEKSGCD